MRLLSKLRRLFGRHLTCEDANRFLSSYLDGELDKSTTERFSMHINRCPTCSDFLDKYKTTIDLCQESKVEDVPAELVSETLEFLRKNW